MSVYIKQGLLSDASLDTYMDAGIQGYIYNMDTIVEKRFVDYIGKNNGRLDRIEYENFLVVHRNRYLQKLQKKTNVYEMADKRRSS